MTAKRSVTIAGHRTSISVEDAFWDALGEIADRTNCSQSSLVEAIDRRRPPDINLSSAIRLFVLWAERHRPSA